MAAPPDFGDTAEVFLILRSQIFLVDREPQLELPRPHQGRHHLEFERGLKRRRASLPGPTASAPRSTAAWGFFETYDLLVSPCASTPAFEVNLRHPETIDGKRREDYLSACC